MSGGSAGAEAKPGRRALLVCLPVLLVVAAAACGDGRTTRLSDGSSASEVPTQLKHLGDGLVMTAVTVVPAHRVRQDLASCDPTIRLAGGRRVVHRVGVETESLTFRSPPSDVRGCDGARDAAVEHGGRWCGTGVGLLTLGRLRDPRLELCQDSAGEPVAAFAWIEPSPRARWIVVDEEDRKEVYPLAGALPVRIATDTEIDAESASAVFDYAEYDADGRLIQRTTIQPFVAG